MPNTTVNIDSIPEKNLYNSIFDNILDCIGNTPCVRLRNIEKAYGLECELVAKVEYFNAAGSVKDRIGKRMIEGLEEDGIIKQGHTVIEPTSGNTGIGLALASAVKGYNAVITLPQKMSKEKVDVLKALGADIVRTPTEAAWDSPDSHIGVANRLVKEIPNSVIPDQYNNKNNPDAHYYGTGVELLRQCNNKIDMFVAGAGTGGTIAGVAKRLKEHIPNVTVVGVDPVGSILAQPASLNEGGEGTMYQVEGIGYDFIPNVLDRSYVDEWIKSEDKESFLMARKLIREEGLLCGGSSGCSVAAAVKVAKRLGKGQRCVVVLPDSLRNYMTKFLSDEWMKDHGFTDQETEKMEKEKIDQWHGATIADLKLPVAVCVNSTVSCKEVIEIMNKNSFDQLPVTSAKTNKLLGLVTMGHILSKVSSGKATLDGPVKNVMFNFNLEVNREKVSPSSAPDFVDIGVNTRLQDLSDFFEQNPAAVVTGADREVKHVVTKIDLLTWLMHKS